MSIVQPPPKDIKDIIRIIFRFGIANKRMSEFRNEIERGFIPQTRECQPAQDHT
jgi:hypothetical protein